MGIVKHGDIKGYRIDQVIVCTECITDDEKKEIEQNDIITEKSMETEDADYFCDRCGEKIN